MNTDIQSQNKDIDIARIFRVFLMQSKMILAIITLGIIAGISFYSYSTKEYRVSSLLQVYSSSPSRLDSSGISDLLLGSSNSSASDVELLINLYETRSNMLKVIERFNLNILVHNDKLDFKINHINHNFDENKAPFRFFIKFNSTGYDVFNEDEIKQFSGAYDSLLSSSDLIINISKPNFIPSKKVKITYRYPPDLYSSLRSKFSLEAIRSSGFGSSDGLIKIGYITDDKDKGIKIIDYANKIFLESSIEFETEKARKAINFLDSQLITVSKILDEKKQKFKVFKEENQSVNVDLEIKTIIDKVSKIEENINVIDIELAEASSKFTPTNPVLLSLNDRKQILVNQKSSVDNRIRSLPIAEQQYIDLFRDVEISQELFLDLSNRKLGFSIMEASTLGNIRIVDEAYLDRKVSPSLMIVIFSVLLSGALSLIVAAIRATLFMPITNPAELNDSGLDAKIYGVIPDLSEKDNLNQTNYDRSIESMVLNLKSIDGFIDSSKIICVTSPTENNGKSFVSRSLSKKLSDMGYKTLLMDCDLVRGDQHKELKKSKITEQSFFEIQESNIENYHISDNLYFIPKIQNLIDKFNFVHNDRYLEKLTFLKEHFDFVIIDTAPALSISETSILMSYSDINMLLVRHNISRVAQVKQTYYLSEQIGSTFDGIIYNGYSKSKSYYGYYGVYGDYRYQYYADRYLYNYKYNDDK